MMARRHIMHTCTSSVASPKLSLDELTFMAVLRRWSLVEKVAPFDWPSVAPSEEWAASSSISFL